MSAGAESNSVSANQSPALSLISSLMFIVQTLFGALGQHEEKAQARGHDFSGKFTAESECNETHKRKGLGCHSFIVLTVLVSLKQLGGVYLGWWKVQSTMLGKAQLAKVEAGACGG